MHRYRTSDTASTNSRPTVYADRGARDRRGPITGRGASAERPGDPRFAAATAGGPRPSGPPTKIPPGIFQGERRLPPPRRDRSGPAAFSRVHPQRRAARSGQTVSGIVARGGNLLTAVQSGIRPAGSEQSPDRAGGLELRRCIWAGPMGIPDTPPKQCPNASADQILLFDRFGSNFGQIMAAGNSKRIRKADLVVVGEMHQIRERIDEELVIAGIRILRA